MTQAALVLGEVLVDVVDGRSMPGGSAANVAVALARLGRPVCFATAYADDSDGRLLRDHLESAGVQPASEPGVVERTSRAIATLEPDGSARYEFDLDWRLGPVTMSQQPCVIHFGSLAAVLEPGASSVLQEVRARRGDVPVSYDINARPEVTGTGAVVRDRVEECVRLADVVKASDEDLAAFWPGASLDEAAEHLLALGPAAVVVTRGAEGARWLTHTGAGDVAPVRVPVADTIGAGDTFSAGLIDGLWGRTDLAGVDWPAVVDRAARAAAVTVSRPGADPPTRAEVDQVVSR